MWAEANFFLPCSPSPPSAAAVSYRISILLASLRRWRKTHDVTFFFLPPLFALSPFLLPPDLYMEMRMEGKEKKGGGVDVCKHGEKGSPSFPPFFRHM